jgi:hypothetical protein
MENQNVAPGPSSFGAARRRPRWRSMLGAADEQANAHPVALRRVERIEQPPDRFRFETYPGIPHRQAYAIVLVPLRSDHQSSRAIFDTVHPVCGIPEQVQDDLLKLNAIAVDGREVVGKFLSPHDPACQEFTDNSATTSRTASLRSNGSAARSLFGESARNRVITSDARCPSRMVRRAVSTAP